MTPTEDTNKTKVISQPYKYLSPAAESSQCLASMPYLGIIDMRLTIPRIAALHDGDYGLLTYMKPQFSAQACDVGRAFPDARPCSCLTS